MASAKKLLERMRRTKHGWTYADVEKVYLDAGFEKREGGGHSIFTHPQFPVLYSTVKRHVDLGAVYVDSLLVRLDQLEALQQEVAQREENENT